jgi:hypothetical protein
MVVFFQSANIFIVSIICTIMQWLLADRAARAIKPATIADASAAD